ncbi:MAG: tetratricopeptide repeat protein, partial [Myxococcales bacterium]|nr:tetratricopeptide repeat protein [Myxococcales bacterium]
SLDTCIISQAKDSCTQQKNLLQEIQPGIFVLTIPKTHNISPIEIKKISDRAQYSILPNRHDNTPLIKLTFNQIKNLCYNEKDCNWAQYLSNYYQYDPKTHVIFFYHSSSIEDQLKNNINKLNLIITEKLSNKTLILSNNKYHCPFNISQLVAYALWRNEPIKKSITAEMHQLEKRFLIFPLLHKTLEKNFKNLKWQLSDGLLRYSYEGVSKNFDYASLTDDMLAGNFKESIEENLSGFKISDLDTSSSFPTVAVRSLIHLKARPHSLSCIQNGYAICAAKEYAGKQHPISYSGAHPNLSYERWLARSSRHLARHNYQARVIFSDENNPQAFSLVGEQVASIAIFPKLVKGVFEQLEIPVEKSARLIAHNEDVLTIATESASWQEINEVNRKAETLFKMVATDGADPLSLFEKKLLPNHGAGTFHFSKVPHEFFDLLDTAHTMKQSMPPGHDHYLIGLAYECLHEWSMAVEYFQKALRQDRTDPDILNALGSAHLELGQASVALPFIKRAFDLLPQDPEVADSLGRINLECGKIDDAIKAFERAVRLSPASANFLSNLGNGYMLASRTKEALSMFTKALQCNPNFAPAHESLAYLHIQSGDESEAKKHALLAFKENPVDPNIANLLWRLTLGKKDSREK